jgi:hypothetical protein
MSATYDYTPVWQWGTREERLTDNQKALLQFPFLLKMGSSLIEAVSSISNAPFNVLAHGTSSINARIEQTLRQLVLRQVAVPHPADVRSYLVKNSDLLNVLPPLCEDVARRFDQGTKLSLEYYQDPQLIDNDYLCLYLKSAVLDMSAIEEIDKIADAYSEPFANITGWILVAPDFRAF